jgi:outer membrane receptor protein involved in Fe transport
LTIMTTRERLLASSMICGAALVGLAATPADAQQAPATATAGNQVSEIVVTGTRIPTPNLTSVSPVTALTSAEIKAQGVTRVEDLINSLPQAFASQGSFISNGSTGTATVNLRGLGTARTLVLIDGRRLMPGDPAVPAADLNFIPTPLVERVDVLTGGASATYGADAVAGVVNFIMLKNFEGVRVDVQASEYQHNQHSDVAPIVSAKQAAAATVNPVLASLFKLPGDVTDGRSQTMTLVLGVNAPDGKGNVEAYVSYRHDDPVLQAERDFSVCNLFSGDVFTCGGSGTAYPARVGSFIVDPTGPGNTFRARTAGDVYNFGPTNYFLRPDDRYSLGAFAHYEIAPWATAYSDVMFMDDHSVYQIAPGGIFAGTFSINCSNPLLSAQEAANMPATAATGGGTCASNPAGTFTGIVARRNIEGGTRNGDDRHMAYRIVTGMRGDLGDDWSYDGYLQYGSTTFHQVQTGFFRTQAIINSLNVVNVNGVPTCTSVVNGTDTACVPYNIFKLGAVSQAALNYLETPSFNQGNTTELVADLAFTGKLGAYGVKSPWATEGVGVAFGAEYRREHLDSSADFVAASGALNGAGGASPPVNGSFDVYELFGEARVPIVEDMPFAKRIQLELGYRYSDYSTAGTTNTYKIAGDWEVISGLRFRAGYNRAVRAPNVIELFSPQNVVLDGTIDPCAGLTAGNPLVAKCMTAFNLTQAQVLSIEKNPAPQYNGQTGGNPNLAPEISDTYTAGFVYQPDFLPGFNFSVDWFNIKVDKLISGIGADTIINRCVQQDNPFFCGLVHRDANLSLWLSPQGFIQDTTLNTGGLKTDGIDFNAGYRTDLSTFGLDGWGGINVTFVGTYLAHLKTESLPGDPFFDCAGLYGAQCGTPNPKWRHKMRVTWNTPWNYGEWMKNLSVSAQWRYFKGVSLDAYSSDPQLNNPGVQYATDRVLGSRSYLDLEANFTIKDNMTFRIGVNNVFDKDPPLNGASNCPTGPCNGNTWPQVYDALGRFLFVGLSADF